MLNLTVDNCKIADNFGSRVVTENTGIFARVGKNSEVFRQKRFKTCDVIIAILQKLSNIIGSGVVFTTYA